MRKAEIFNENIWEPFPSVYVINKQEELTTFCLVNKGPTPVMANGVDKELLKIAEKHRILTDWFTLD